jgi:predicted DNA-binding transcriptional regulator AlpA
MNAQTRIEAVADKLLTLAEIGAALGKPKVTLYRWMREGRFPKTVKIRPNSVGIWSSDFVKWKDGLSTPKAEKIARSKTKPAARKQSKQRRAA